MTNREIAQRIADIQWQMYDFYGIDSLPAADSNCANHDGLLKGNGCVDGRPAQQDQFLRYD